MVLPIRILASAARDEVAWLDSSAMAASAAEHAAAIRLGARRFSVLLRINVPQSCAVVSTGAASAQRLKTLFGFQRSKLRCPRVPGARFCRVALHADRPQVCKH